MITKPVASYELQHLFSWQQGLDSMLLDPRFQNEFRARDWINKGAPGKMASCLGVGELHIPFRDELTENDLDGCGGIPSPSAKVVDMLIK